MPTKQEKRIRFPVEVAAFCSIALALLSLNGRESVASAGSESSWSSSKTPSWATKESPPSKKSVYREPKVDSVSPFSPGSHNVALELGQVFLMGDYGARYSDAIAAQLHYNYGVSDLFAFDSSLAYSSHSDGKFSMTSFLAGLRTNLSWFDKVIPYVTFGLGFYRPSYSFNTAAGSEIASLSPLLFGLHLGPGVDLELTKTMFFGANLTFHDVFGSQQASAAGPVDVGGSFTSFMIRAGMTF